MGIAGASPSPGFLEAVSVDAEVLRMRAIGVVTAAVLLLSATSAATGQSPVRFTLSIDSVRYCRGIDRDVGEMLFVLGGRLTNIAETPLAVCVRCVVQASVKPLDPTEMRNLSKQTDERFEFTPVSSDDFVVVPRGGSIDLHLNGSATVSLPGRSVDQLPGSGVTDFTFSFYVGGWDPAQDSELRRRFGSGAVVLQQRLPETMVRVDIRKDRTLVNCDSLPTSPSTPGVRGLKRRRSARRAVVTGGLQLP